MSKGNLFLGMASGSVGDVTMYHTNGQQIARARNRHPSNPRSDAQLYQRAILATISRVYQLGHAIFDHSFQGYRLGAENQRRFQKLNLNALRAQIAADVAAGTSLARVGAPGVSAPTANRYIISEGTYQNTLLIPAADGSVQFPQPVAGETIGQYAARVGLIDDDIYTIVVIGVSPTDFAYEYETDEGQHVQEASLGRAAFHYLQFRVKNGVQAATEPITGDTELSDIFQVFPDKVPFNGYTLSSTITFADLVENPDWDNGAIGVIRSRDDSDLRSSTTMQLVGVGTFGITARWLLDVWRKETQIGQSDLILEGSNFARESYEPVTPVEPADDGFYYIPDLITANNQSARNLVVQFIVGYGIVIPLIGDALSVAGGTGLWQHVADEEDVARAAFDVNDEEINVNVTQANAWATAIYEWWNQHYGTSYELTPFVAGDIGETLEVITAGWKGSI